ncbi:membrane metallo-endopeptidase-like 1 [Drosophila rhopaloa]|uniref:Membrane metallo-endopeptidase-like 1 n=1 Tax=Drosophila rhopaloa TaxID=1041015 RepID=A0ABM5I4M1_DRORH|nr:membrane metallo-endopeptidase-like 1 [Drosophila rhopaloa]
MLQQVNVCTNFEKYVCGNFPWRYSSAPFVNSLEMLDYNINTKLVQLMEELEQSSPNETSVEAKALQFYRTCRQAPPETRKLGHYLGMAPPAEGLTWPPLTPPGNAWPKDQFKWMETVAEMVRYGLNNVLINVEVSQNWQNTTETLLQLGSPKPNELINTKDARRALRDMGVSSDKITTLLRRMRKLESDIESLIKWHNKGQIEIVTVHQMEKRTGYEWQKFVEQIVGHAIQPNFRVRVKNWPYLVDIKELIDTADAELVANYIMTRFFLFLQQGITGGQDAIDCVRDLRLYMDVASNLLYKERFLNTTELQLYTQEVEDLFEEIRQQLLLKIEHNRYELTSEQKEYVSRKVQDVVLNIGNMPKGRDHRSFANEHYEGVEFPSTDLDFGREYLKMKKFLTQKVWSQLHGSPLSPEETLYLYWMKSIPTSLLRYYPLQNTIFVGYGVLQEPYFVLGSHEVFKFSKMGFGLGHELMHAIDNQLFIFDSRGNVNEIGIEIATSPRFRNSMNCLAKSGSTKLSELSADIGGFDLAYSAYLSKTRNSTDFTYFTPQQIFLINMAQGFCSDGYPRPDEQHDDDIRRINQMWNLGNPPPYLAFGCPQETQPCQLW